MLNLYYILLFIDNNDKLLSRYLFFYISRDNLSMALIDLFSTKLNRKPGKSSLRAQPRPTQSPSDLNIRLGLMLCCEGI